MADPLETNDSAPPKFNLFGGPVLVTLGYAAKMVGIQARKMETQYEGLLELGIKPCAGVSETIQGHDFERPLYDVDHVELALAVRDAEEDLRVKKELFEQRKINCLK